MAVDRAFETGQAEAKSAAAGSPTSIFDIDDASISPGPVTVDFSVAQAMGLRGFIKLAPDMYAPKLATPITNEC